MNPKVCILPTLSEYGDRTWGGVLRCVEALYKFAPFYGWDTTESPDEADVVHTLGMKEHPKSKIYTCLGFWENPEAQYQNAQAKIERLAQQAEVFTVLSQWSKEFFDEKLGIDAIVINNGADYAKMQQVLNIVSNKWPEGNYFLWAKAGLYYPNCHYGPTPVLELARQMPSHLFNFTIYPIVDIPENAYMLGRMPYNDMLETIAQCKVYISTVKETFGAQTIEAMAMGKPVLAYDFGGNSEILTHKVDGFLVPPGESLLEGAEYILGNYESMSRAVRFTAMKYDWKSAIIPKYVKCWDRLLDGN